jgi:hypothetical protein
MGQNSMRIRAELQACKLLILKHASRQTVLILGKYKGTVEDSASFSTLRRREPHDSGH